MNLNEWILLLLSFNLIIFGGSYKLFKLAGVEGWKSLIPIYNIVKHLDIINRPRWWAILVFIPVINLLMIPVIWVEFIKTFNHNSKLDRVLVIITLGFYIYYISYLSSKTKYIGKIDFSNFEKSIGSFVFAIVIATIVHNYILQPFVIPTGSLEKTLRVGDFLLVSKFHYGARIPSTVISFPMVHDTIPIIKSRSYLNKPQLPYIRIPGFQEIKNNDIVVFNWPADTVRKFFVREKGVKKPIDKKSNYVKRCVAIPSDTLEIINGLIHINGKRSEMPYRAKPIYSYSAHNSKRVSTSKLVKLGIEIQRKFKVSDISQTKFDQIQPYILQLLDNNPQNFTILTNSKGIPYDIRSKWRIVLTELTDYTRNLLLTEQEAKIIRKSNLVDSLVRSYRNFKSYNTNYFPNDIKYNWNEDNFGPIILPEKGSSVKLNPRNLPLYKKIIRDYEKNELTLLDGEIKINGKTTQEYTFKQDYYWMMGDNRYRSEDSRSWGFVPEDHIVGKPVFIWMSIEGINDGFKNWKIRWDRVFTTVNLDGEPKSYRWYFLIGILIVLGYSEFQKRKTKTK